MAPPMYTLERRRRDMMISKPHCYLMPMVAVRMDLEPKKALYANWQLVFVET